MHCTDISLRSPAQSQKLWPLKKHSNIKITPWRVSGWRREPNYYTVLSLDSENAGVDEIKKAYRSMALQYHPDVCPPCRKEESTRMFVQLQKAYETLLDPIARNRYDRELRSLDLAGRKTNDDERGEQGNRFSKHGLEEQLRELKRRSDARLERKEKN